MLNWIKDQWREAGNRNEELATVRGMLKASEAKNARLAEHLAVLDRRIADMEHFLHQSVILRKV